MNIVLDGESLPVCSNGERLDFMSDCVVSVLVLDRLISSHEVTGNSWDGASIPRRLWFIFGHPLSREYRWASFWHDRLCEKSNRFPDGRTQRSLRKLADDVFLELLGQAGVSKKKRWAMWLGVRGYAFLRMMRWV